MTPGRAPGPGGPGCCASGPPQAPRRPGTPRLRAATDCRPASWAARAKQRASLDIGLRGGDRLLGLHHRQERARHRGLHLEPREAFAGPRASQRGFGAPHLGGPEPEVERLPREQRPGSACPMRSATTRPAAAGRRCPARSTAATAGPVTLFTVARLVCHTLSSRGRDAAFATLDPRRRCVDLFDGRLDRWVVVSRVLQRLLQRERLRRRGAAAGVCAAAGVATTPSPARVRRSNSRFIVGPRTS